MTEVAALASIAKAALETFSSLAKDELLLLWNSQKELKKLEATINTLTNITYDADAEGRESKGRAMQDFLSRMRNAMYDAEDLFDGLTAQVLRKRTTGGNKFTKEVRLFFSESNQLGIIVKSLKTAHAVKSIRESLDALMKDMGFINGTLMPVTSAQQPVSVVSRETDSDVHEEDVIGRKEDRDCIIKMLLPQDKGETSNNQSLSVIAIIGFGGLGKTTLAKYVYNHESVKHGFDVQLWVCMKDLSNKKQVLIKIIGSYEKGDHSASSDVDMLQKELREKISGKKYLLVLDDVWDVTAGNWSELKGVLRYGGEGSKVIVTTRSIKVANCLEASNCVDLAVLSEESAWSLFVKKAFVNEEELRKNSELEPLGKEIVRRCGKVPLAVVIIGSLFRGINKDMRTWSDFLENDLKRTIVMGGDRNQDSIKDVLMISYNHLFPNLKPCFAFCSLFPKNYRFDKDELVRLWIAQGFIKLDNGQTLDKQGEYFFLLVEKCFFQEVKQKPISFEDDENVRYGKFAKIHDLLHDMATDIAKAECALIDRASMVNRDERNNLRHISISCEVDNSFDYCSLASDPKRVRTLIIHSEKRVGKNTVNLLPLSRFRMLRVLHLSRLRVENIESVGELTYLRYLNLSHNHELVHLPDSICKLHQLMILVLVHCNHLEGLPPKLENLVSLTQLYIHGCLKLGSIPSGLTTLTSLVKLDRIVVHRETGGLRYLQDLDNLLGILTIELPREGWLDAVEDARKGNMSRKLKLSGMDIKWTDLKDKKMHKDEAKAVLDALKPHTNLEYLKITNYEGEILSSWVGTLRCVTELHLYDCNQMEYLLDDVSDFPSLKQITLNGLPNLKGWWRQVVEETRWPCYSKVSSVHVFDCPKLKGQMPLFEEVENLSLSRVDMALVIELLNQRKYYNLQNLSLSDIADLMSLPEGWLRHLTHLQKLEVWECENLKWVSCRGLAYLTALKELQLFNGKITDIGDDEEMKMRESGMPWKALKRLVSLLLPGKDEHLLEGLQYLESLESLEIENWIDKEGGTDHDETWEEEEVTARPAELRNLHELKIGFDNRTAQLPTFIQYLPSLEFLRIRKCKELYLGWKSLLSMKLVVLEFHSVKKVIGVEDKAVEVEQQSQLRTLVIWHEVPEWVNDVPWNSLSSSLRYLYLLDIEGMEQLPDGIQHLTSLRILYIQGCEKLRSLPDWIPNLTSLGQLEIRCCSAELKSRCQEGGEDWHLIQHIPEKDITTASVERISDGELEEGSRKKGGCGGLSLSKFKRIFH